MIRPTLVALVSCLALGAVAAAAAGQSAVKPAGEWVGTYTLRAPDDVSIALSARNAVVSVGVGHTGAQRVRATINGNRVRFQLPGRPAPVVFDGRLKSGTIEGSVRHGVVRGTFRLRRGVGRTLVARGIYGPAGGLLGVVQDPFGPPRLVDLETGEVRGLFPAGAGFTIGSGWAAPTPPAGSAGFDVTGANVRDRRLGRWPLRQLLVRFGSGGVLLAGTLTLPAGPGPHPAVAFVHGGGRATRAYLPDLHALLLRHGVAVLGYDKRGVGQSAGRYVFNAASAATIDQLARDASAAARFLAAQPEIDPARVGLVGHSQAGWVMPLAASREKAVRFLISFAGPTATQGETDTFAAYTGGGNSPPPRSVAEIEAEVARLGRVGVDPIPWIRALRIPALWLFGGRDLIVPTKLSLSRLEPVAGEPGRDFRFEVLPNGNHALVETETGLNSEMLRSNTWARGLFPLVGEWLRSHGLGE